MNTWSSYALGYNNALGLRTGAFQNVVLVLHANTNMIQQKISIRTLNWSRKQAADSFFIIFCLAEQHASSSVYRKIRVVSMWKSASAGDSSLETSCRFLAPNGTLLMCTYAYQVRRQQVQKQKVQYRGATCAMIQITHFLSITDGNNRENEGTQRNHEHLQLIFRPCWCSIVQRSKITGYITVNYHRVTEQPYWIQRWIA